MKKVLFISMGESFGGIEKLELDLSKNIKKYKIEFLTPIKIFDNGNDLNTSRKNILGKIKYNYKLYKYLKKNKYDIIHINSSVFLFNLQVALISKITNHNIIIQHSHSIPKISKKKLFIIKILSPLLNNIITESISCSAKAKKSLFMKKAIILKNGIEISQFKYNEKIRNIYRKKLKIEKDKVYGTIGRIDKNKNHEFLIDLFYELQKNNSNSKLIIIGTGKEEDILKEKIEKLNIKNKVLFLGYREDIGSLLSSMDYFIFPSLSEGFGISIIEALTSGLPTLISKNIPIDNINNLYKMDNYNKEEWIEKIKKIKLIDRKNAYKEIIKNGYDIKKMSKDLEEIYKELIK